MESEQPPRCGDASRSSRTHLPGANDRLQGRATLGQRGQFSCAGKEIVDDTCAKKAVAELTRASSGS